METKLISIDKIGESYYIIKLEKPENYVFNAGQFARLSLDRSFENEKNFRVFSIASSSDEDCLMFATKALPNKISLFKQALFNMKKGEIIDISKPSGKFTLRDEVSPLVLYASGIGVTPIRSLVKNIAKKASQEIHIVYASYDNYIFEDEFETFAKKPNIHFIKTREIDETTAKLAELADRYKNSAYYYTSGSPFVCNSVREGYIKAGISGDRIIDDVFLGY